MGRLGGVLSSLSHYFKLEGGDMLKLGRKKTSKAKGKAGTKEGIKDPGIQAPPANNSPKGKPPKVIKMNMSLGNQFGSYIKGKNYRVPHEVPVNTARSWVRTGAAEDVSPK